ncbi:hypothetical protein [Pedobacter antarcticus]|uniref:hypothetical protein n=1 Tax=Pedobacter antarcticus TaxID=34086 RepID=UPI00293093E6|nr:hypothetical protein [Pedobacter antarcticus]
MKRKQGFDKSGIRFTEFEASEKLIEHLKDSWKLYVSKDMPPYPGHYLSKGIVMCGGGIKYFTCTWVSISQLRVNGCALPIELWYQGGELNGEVINKLKELDVVCKNVNDYTSSIIKGYAIKPFAILNSSFKEVLFLDADNTCISDPTTLFEQPEFKENGAVFWPDFWKTDPNNPIWKIIEANDYDEYEQESGQLLIHKEYCWAALNLCMYFNLHSDTYYQFLLGDKDTFKFAWKALKKPYAMIATPVGFCGYSDTAIKLFSRGVAMVQHGFDGEILFIHQNLAKWDVVKDGESLWGNIKRFKSNGKNRIFIQEELKHANGRQNLIFDIDGDISLSKCESHLLKVEKNCLEILADLRKSGFYLRFILYLYLSRFRGEV